MQGLEHKPFEPEIATGVERDAEHGKPVRGTDLIAVLHGLLGRPA